MKVLLGIFRKFKNYVRMKLGEMPSFCDFLCKPHKLIKIMWKLVYGNEMCAEEVTPIRESFGGAEFYETNDLKT